MQIISRVIVGFDGSEQGRDALSLGSTFASAGGSELVVACVCERNQDSEMDQRFSEVDAALGRRRYRRRELWGSPARELTRVAEDTDASLLVVGSTHEGKLSRVLPGSVGERLLNGAPCAVAVAPLGFAKRDGFRERLIGVGYIGNDESRLALGWAESLARQLGSRLRLIAVIPPLTSGWLPADVSAREHRRRVWSDLEETLSAASLGAPDLSTEREVIEGDPAAVLAEQGGELDLLVVGSRGYGPLRRVLLGGVSGRVIQDAPCPVVVVPRGAKETSSHPDRPPYMALES
jgi:nucleotide-binding universal stress UspA family protein